MIQRLDLHCLCRGAWSVSGWTYMLLSQMFGVLCTVHLLINIELMGYCIIVCNVCAALKFSVAGARTDWLAKASGLCAKQLMTRTWMANISIGPVVLNASTKRSSISGLSVIAFKTSNTSSASGGSFINWSLFSRWWRECVIRSTKFWISLMNCSVKTVPLYGPMLSQLSLRVLAISLIAMLGRDTHFHFQSFNVQRILLSDKFCSASP